jgi:phosphate transport system substrate-binding protein
MAFTASAEPKTDINMSRLYIISAALFGSLVWLSCNSEHRPSGPGFSRVYADATLKPLTDSEITAFEGLRPENLLERKDLAEDELFSRFLSDSVRFIIATRKLSKEERAYFSSQQLLVNESHIATDGIALIVNRSAPLDSLGWQQLRDIVNGGVLSWQQLNAKERMSLQVVFDDPHSAIVRQLLDSLGSSRTMPSSFYALHSASEVVDHVEKNKNSIGLIGMSWISEHSDTSAGSFLTRIKVLALENPSDGKYRLPYQAYLATHDYPLTRNVYLITRGNGAHFPFASYLASDKGQRVVLKMGLVPATAPVRLIHTQPR